LRQNGTADGAAAASRLFARRVSFVSPGSVALAKADLGLREGLLVKDPDGHAMQLV